MQSADGKRGQRGVSQRPPLATRAADGVRRASSAPGYGLLRPLVDVLEGAIGSARDVDPFVRDPRVVARLAPLVALANRYFSTEFRGFEKVPARGPFLLIGNHSGGAETNDFWFLLGKWIAERGADSPLYALAYDLLLAVPALSWTLRRLGVVPASPANARGALERGAAVLVFPGGDYEVFRPWSERNRVDFGRHTGYVEIALQCRVRVVPVVIYGAHQSTFVLTRGRFLAHLLGTDRIRVNVFPLIWNLPFGLTPAFVPSVQLPSKVTIEFLPPLDWSRLGRRAATDPGVVQACNAEVVGLMQSCLDRLAAETPHPILARFTGLLP